MLSRHDPSSSQSLLKLFAWIFANKKKFKLRAVSRLWPAKVGIRQSDVAIFGRSIFSKRSSSGLGFGKNRIEAYSKAMAEIIEREIQRSFKIKNSNGCAVHFFRDHAITNARMELLERDAFLCYFFSGTAFKKIPLANISFHNHKGLFFKRKLSQLGFDLQVYEMKTAVQNVKGVVVTIESKSKSRYLFAIGHACAFSFSQAAEHAFNEAMRTVDWLHFNKNTKRRPLTVKRFFELHKRRGHSTVEDHLRLWLNPEYVQLLKEQIFHSSIPAKGQAKAFLDLKDIPVFLRRKNSIFPGLPLYFCKAKSAKIQELFFGPTNLQLVNLARIEKFQGLAVKKVLNIPSFPHPIA